MTSKLTREQRINEVKELIANAEEWAGFYEHPIHDKPQREMFEGMANVMSEHLAALAAMDSEPHTDDELSNLLWYSQEATCHSDPNYYCEFQRLATPGLIAGIIRELQERRKADSEPVAVVEPSDYVTAAQLVGEGPARKAVHELYEGALRIGDKLYRHAQPAPETEREPIAWLNDAYLARGVVDGEAGSEDAGPGYIPVYREASPAQPAPVVPEEMTAGIAVKHWEGGRGSIESFVAGCNFFRAAMLNGGKS